MKFTNRKIKFRVWTGATMEYKVLAGALGHFYVEGMSSKDSACLSDANTIYPEDTPLMQWTGLVDGNGKEIYEGDILSKSHTPYDENDKSYLRFYEIGWSNGETFGFNCDEYSHLITGFISKFIKSEDKSDNYRIGEVTGLGKKHEFYNCGSNNCLVSTECVIIGNIFQNPELLNAP